jgi:hypothetical protein
VRANANPHAVAVLAAAADPALFPVDAGPIIFEAVGEMNHLAAITRKEGARGRPLRGAWTAGDFFHVILPDDHQPLATRTVQDDRSILDPSLHVARNGPCGLSPSLFE